MWRVKRRQEGGGEQEVGREAKGMGDSQGSHAGDPPFEFLMREAAPGGLVGSQDGNHCHAPSATLHSAKTTPNVAKLFYFLLCSFDIITEDFRLYVWLLI